jgi:hypothetical protein
MPCGHLEPRKYRLAIDFFLLPSSQRQKKSISSLRSPRLCGKKFSVKEPIYLTTAPSLADDTAFA